MNTRKTSFNVLASVERHIEALKPLLPKQAIVCIGEYPIKILLKDPSMSKTEGTLSVLIEKSSDDIYHWIPRGFSPYLILGFEDVKIDTHFWYDALPYITKDETVMDTLKKKAMDKMHGATIVASVWDGIASAFMPALMSKFKSEKLKSLSIAVLPSRVQPIDAQFNAFAAIQRSLGVEGAPILLTDRDHLESYEGIDRKGLSIKGNLITNYLVNFLLSKEVLVEEISELSRTFKVPLYTFLLVTGASYKIYGSIENMLNAALLKPFLTFDLSSASLVYVLLRMPTSLKDKLPRGKIELAVATWFKDKATLQSIYITEPLYTDDPSDRIDVVLFIGGFDASQILGEYEQKSRSLKSQAVEKGLMTEDWQLPIKPEEINVEEPPKVVEIPPMQEPVVEVPKVEAEPKQVEPTPAAPVDVATVPITEPTQAPAAEIQQKTDEPKPARRLRLRRTKKADSKKK